MPISVTIPARQPEIKKQEVPAFEFTIKNQSQIKEGDSRLDLLDGLGIGLRDDEAHAELRRAAVDALRLPDIRIAPSGVGTSDNLGGIYKIL